MCTVSSIGDNWGKRFPEVYPWAEPLTKPYPVEKTVIINSGPTQAEFDALKREVQELKELLKAAKKFDEATNQPHCEQEDKIAMIKK